MTWAFLAHAQAAAAHEQAAGASEPATPVRKGINLTGANDLDAFWSFPSTTAIDYYVGRGFNFARIVFRWERLQPTPGGALDATHLGLLDDAVRYAVSKGMRVTICPHNFGGRALDGNVNGTKYKIGTAEITQAHFSDLWSRLATEFADIPEDVVFDLMNEPESMPASTYADGTYALCAHYNAAIDAIRTAGFTGLIALEGHGWNNAQSFDTDPWYSTTGITNGDAFQQTILDPLDRWCASVNNYPDSGHGSEGNSVSATALRTRMENVISWCQATGRQVIVGEFATGDSDTQAPGVVTDFLSYLSDNAQYVIGWCWWEGRSRLDTSSTYNLEWNPVSSRDDAKLRWLSLGPTQNDTIATSDSVAAVLNPFTPASIANLVFWIDANTGVTGTPGSTITAVNDQSTANNDVTVPDSPTWTQNAFGTGKHGFTFAAGDYLAFGASDPLSDLQYGIVTANGYSAVALIDTTTSDTTETQTGINPPMTVIGNRHTWTYQNFGLSGGNVRYAYYDNVGNAWATLTSTGLSLNDGNPHTIAVTHSTGGTIKLYADGVEAATVSNVGFATATTGASTIGAGYGLDDPFIGIVGFAVVYDAALTAQNIADLHDYATGGQVYESTLSDTVSTSDALARTATFRSTLTDTASTTTALAQTASFQATLTDTVAGTDALARTATFGAVLSQAESVTDALTRTATFGAVLSASVSESDALARTATFGATVAVSVSATDALLQAPTLGAVVADAVDVADSLAQTANFRRVQADAENVTDALLRSATYASGNASAGGGAGDIIARFGSRCVRWYKDYDSATGTWNDEVGGGDATDDIQGLTPTQASTTGGQSYPDFEGNDQLQGGAISSLPTYASTHRRMLGFLLRVDSTGVAQWLYGTDNYNTYVTAGNLLNIAGATSNASVADGVWRRVIAVKNGAGNVTLYLNGVAQTTTGTGTLGSDWKTSTGQTYGDRPGGGYPLNGGLASMAWLYDTSVDFSGTDVANLDADLQAILETGVGGGAGDTVEVTDAASRALTKGASASDTVSVTDDLTYELFSAGQLYDRSTTDTAALLDEIAARGGTRDLLVADTSEAVADALASTLIVPVVLDVGVATAAQELNAVAHGGSYTLTTPSTDVTVSSVNTSTNTITAGAAHGFRSGDGPFRFTTTGTLPAPLSTGTDYYVINVSSTEFRVATSGSAAIASSAVDITDTGSGTHTLVRTVDTTSAGSFFLTFLARGNWNSAPSAPTTDNKSNTYTLLGSTHAYAAYPSARTGVYYIKGAGGADHTWSIEGADYDEITISVLEVLGAGFIAGHSHVERTIGSSTITSESVTTTSRALLVAVCFGNGPVGQDHTFTPGAGWTKVTAASREADMSANGYIQVAVAYKYEATPGTYTASWSGVSNEGGQLYLIALQDGVDVSDTAALTDALARTATFGSVASDAVDVTDAGEGTKSGLVASTVSDAIDVTDALTQTAAFGATVSATLSAADAVTTSGTFHATIADTVSATDALAQTATFAALLADAVDVTFAAEGTRSGLVASTVSDAIDVTDALAQTATFGATSTDTASTSDAVAAALAYARASSDAEATADAVSTSSSFEATLTDAVAAASALAQTAAFARASGDAEATADAVSTTAAFAAVTSDAATTADALAQTADFARVTSDTADATDALAQAPTLGRAASDTAATSDALDESAVFARAASDAEATADGASSASAYHRTTADTSDAADFAFANTAGTVQGVAVDAVEVTEQLGQVAWYVRTETDAATVTETTQGGLGVARVASDTVATADALGGAATFERAASATVATADTLARTATLGPSPADAVDVADELRHAASYVRTAAATVATTDDVQTASASVLDRLVADGLDLTDALARAAELGAATSDVFATTDALGLAATLSRSEVDALAAGELLAQAAAYARAGADALGSTEELLAEVLQPGDVAGITDALSFLIDRAFVRPLRVELRASEGVAVTRTLEAMAEERAPQALVRERSEDG